MSQLRFLESKNGIEVCILDEIQADWRALVDFLELPSRTVRNLRHLDNEDACRETLQMWLDGEGDEDTPRNWHTIITVLRKMKRKSLAKQVQEALTN